MKGCFLLDLIMSYIQALKNLYGIVHKSKVIEIYNLQNEDKINEDTMDYIIKEKKSYLINKLFVFIKEDFFVSPIIMIEEHYFDEELRFKKGKPYYIPEKEELLRYKKVNYFEKNKEYEDLLRFFRKKYWRKSKAEYIAKEIQSYCQSFRALENIGYFFERERMRFRKKEQLEEMMNLIKNLANNTRVWQNNGFTPNEIEKIMEK